MTLQPARRAASQLVKQAANARDLIRRPESGVVVLLYHRVGRRSTLTVDLPAGLFAQQMARLAHGGRVVDLDTALSVLAGRLPVPPFDPVVITFDDGTADFIDEVVPVLARYRLPATLYLATEFTERGMPFADGSAAMSWSAVREVHASGLVAIGSHTHSHALLDRLPDSEVSDDLDRSISLIADHLGSAPRHFAYPKAILGSRAAEQAVRARFVSAVLAGTRANAYGATDPYRVARSPIQVADGLRWFARKLDGGMALEDDLRRLLNRRRYASAVT